MLRIGVSVLCHIGENAPNCRECGFDTQTVADLKSEEGDWNHGGSLAAARNVKLSSRWRFCCLAWWFRAARGTAVGQRGVAEAAGVGGGGETMYVACSDTPVHTKPIAFSRVIGQVEFGQGYTVTGADGFYLPRNQSQEVPAWAKIRYGKSELAMSSLAVW